jgi:TPR repeat protein
MKRILFISICLSLFSCLALAETEDVLQMNPSVSAEDQVRLGDFHFETKNYAEAIKWYKKAAEQDNATAQNNIGQLYKDGLGVSQDYAEAMKWLLKAAAQGEDRAQFSMGEMYEQGLGVAQDHAKAFSFYLKAAQGKNQLASYKAGWFLQNGIGAEKNIKFAIGWYRQAADAGNVDALLALGWICLKGIDEEPNHVAARIWYKRAADKGNANAQYMLGTIYQNGLGTEQDLSEALKWYEMAAKNGNKEAQATLDKIDKDKPNLLAAYQADAAKGDPRAMYNLGVSYDNGIGTPVDHVKAMAWFIKAAQKNGNPLEVYKLELRKELYKEEFKALEKQARDLRDNKVKLPGGFWKLETFYDVLSEPIGKPMPMGRYNDKEDHWQYTLEKLDKWNKAIPESATARIALAQFYVSYGLQAIGGGYASTTVSDQSWEVYRSRLKQAEDKLNEALMLNERCPQWSNVMLKVAMAQGWESKRFNDLFDQAIKFEPSYLAFYERKAKYLSPKWYGNDGDIVKFAEEMEQRFEGKEGLALYSYIVWIGFYNSGDVSKFMQQNLAAWNNVKQGFIYREELYGENYFDLSSFCYMAIFANDKETSRKLFDRIGDNWDRKVFNSKNNFDNLKSSVFK